MRMRSSIIPFIFLVLLVAGCNGGGGDSDGRATVTGRVLDSQGNPVAGALVTVSSRSVEAITDIDGSFSLRVEAGAHRLTVSDNGETMCEVCFTAAEWTTHDLGDLDPSTPSNCETPPPEPSDRDGDGLLDADEESGWEVFIVMGDGSVETREVWSDPDMADTDGDGLDDAEEYGARIDPSRVDTDGDMLSDFGELNVYKSDPTMVDTDGDSCGPDGDGKSDPNLWDGYEMSLSKTSPTLADTDGDGISDYQEINIGGTSPRLADLPQMSLELHGNPLIELDVDYQTGTSARQEELSREEEERIETDSVSTKMSIENTVQLHTESEAGTSTWPPSFNAKLTTDTKFHHGYFHDTSSNWKSTSVEQSQQNYETWENELVSFDDGKLSVAMKVVNQSDLSFKVKDLRVLAYRLEGGGSFTLIGTMAPDELEWPEGGHILGPGGEFTMAVKREHIGAEMMRALVRNPMAMTFEVGSYSLFQLDEWGVEETVNFAKLGESVVQRTGIVVVDYGDGRVERHMAATNVYRNPDGSARGVALSEVLADVIGLDYETVESVDEQGQPGPQVLHRIKDRASYDKCNENSDAYDPNEDCVNLHKRAFWLVGGTGQDFEGGSQVDFDDITLRNGERVSLVYNEDTDGDGIFDREEYLLGSDRLKPDTDGDELTDYDESKVGWTVAVSGQEPYEVFPDPRFTDLDGDFLSDKTEFFLGTDPYLKDTDGDGDDDTFDFDPLNPPCLDGTVLGITAWWDGSYHIVDPDYFADDVWTTEAGGIANDGTIFAADPSTVPYTILDDRVFRFNQLPTQFDQYIDVENHESVSPQREFTLSAWVYWNGVASGAEWGTVLSKGPASSPNYALYIAPDGRLKLSIYRNTHEKCWFSWFGYWDDGSCADDDYNQLVELVTTDAIPAQQWVHVAATFSGETMRIYLDGALFEERSTTSTWTSGLYKYRTTTNRLITNVYPLRIAGDNDGTPPVWPFRGLMDDVQVFGRGLKDDQVQQMKDIGVCAP